MGGEFYLGADKSRLMLKFTKHIEEIEKRCRRKGNVLLLLDFDGTLSPIVPHPEMAKLSPQWRKRLKKLKANSGITLGIVTGREAANIRKRMAIPGIILSSDHGCEVWRGTKLGTRCVVKNSRYIKELAKIARSEFHGVKGIVVEEKRYSVAIHYRMVDSSIKASVRKRVEKLTGDYCKRFGWDAMHGKQLIEVRPSDCWHKGDAVKWIEKNYAPRALPIYIGDDTTDEDAFRAIGSKGITIRVGRKKGSAAAYYIDSIDDVVPWFEWMASEM
jgi:trehalose 6-phosphate phosphatase